MIFFAKKASKMTKKRCYQNWVYLFQGDMGSIGLPGQNGLKGDTVRLIFNIEHLFKFLTTNVTNNRYTVVINIQIVLF